MRRSSFIPNETYAPLVVDPDRVLSLPIGPQRLQAIARWYAKITKQPSLIQKTKLSQSNVLDIGRQFATAAARPDQFCFGISEAFNHGAL
jgi:hypothetical protein